MAITTPYDSPNWAKRLMRLNTPKVPKRPDANDPNQAALGMFNSGMRAGADGTLQPTQDYGGLLRKASQGVNSLTRGVKGGQMSSLGKPLNSMYEQNPGFFNRGGNAGGVEGFGQMLAQTREQRIAQAQREGTFDTIRDKYNTENAASGMQMNQFGNLVKNAGSTQPAAKVALPDDTPGAASKAARSNMMQPGAFSGMVKGATRPVDNALVEKRGFGAPAAGNTGRGAATSATASAQDPSQQAMNRARLEEAVSAKKMLQEAQRPPMQIDRKTGGGVDTFIQGKYGTGFATNAPPGVKRPADYEGDVNGRPFSEVMQGLANKPGLARKGDKFQPQQWSDVLKRAKTK